tara:strand:+ start:176 stop:802 length:627 start_codon:yes stop_codon:yes gene_type:complete
MDTNRYKSTFGFVDLLFNLLVGFTFLFMLAFILINPVAKKEAHDPKAEYLVIMSWDDNSKADIDLWIKDDVDTIVGFRAKDVALLTLDRDDLGDRNDMYTSKENVELVPVNREVISIRSKTQRRYVVTTHFYNNLGDPDVTPQNIKIELLQVNPYKILKIVEVTLTEPSEEKHVFEFEVLNDGDVVFHESNQLIVNDVALQSIPYMDR